MARSSKPVGFIGQGWIGKNYADDFERRGLSVVRYSLEEPYRHNRAKIAECDIVIIAVPTPTTPDGSDFSIVREAVSLVGKGKTAVIKSTMLPGTALAIQKDFPDRIVMYSPEFLSEATAAHDASHPFANIIGLAHDTPETRAIAQDILAVLPEAPFSLVCSSTEAEIIKYSHNGSGYTQIIFFNLMYDLARSHGFGWENIQRALEADPLISNRYSRPFHKSGRGAGGHCFIKDVAALSQEYAQRVGDTEGSRLFRAMEQKNIELLRTTGKDLDLLADVYGANVLKGEVTPTKTPELRSIRGDMDILVVTEAIDRTDPLLGFFHRWIEEFARQARRVQVIALGVRERNLPANVIEHSLGKESAHGNRYLKRFVYTMRFLRYVWQLRREYETVLVYLSPEFVLLAWPIWRLTGKRIGYWFNDTEASRLARLAIWLSDVVFYTNPHSYAAACEHSRMVPMGVDADMYAEELKRAPDSLIFLGRITAKKNLDRILKALGTFVQAAAPHLDIYGSPGAGDEAYAAALRSTYATLERRGIITYHGNVLHDKTAEVYGSHDIFINTGSVRGFNKTLFEAMAAGMIVVTSEPTMKGVVDDRLFITDASEQGIARAIHAALSLTPEERTQERSKLRAYVRREHALSSVVPAMLEMLRSTGGELAR
ncbi:MAG TPA: glycosyltransferase [Candidatus Paceibacterota bacterium]|nr:glycosyltransferase [Candidatus Paceibacterota bacterium]